MLRIIGGKYNHLKIQAPESDKTRPTTDKTREALMSILRDDLEGKIVLDLFAGSGALGLQAVSFGAKEVYFCDNNKKAYLTILENIHFLKVNENCHAYLIDALRFLKKCEENKLIFDIVFLDPPYRMKKIYNEVIDYMLEHHLLSQEAVIIKEGDAPFIEDERFQTHKSYKYGICHIMIERRPL